MPDSPNHLLASLAPADFESLRPQLKAVDLVQGTVLFEVGDEMRQVYFPHTGVVSLVVPLASGELIESAMIGRDSQVGGSYALGARMSVSKAIVQIAGRASVMDAEKLRVLTEASPAMYAVLFRHDQLVLAQALQSAACNATHTVEARLSRWLLRSRDLQGSNDLALTQEFLGQMLGVRRTSVSVVANTLQQAGLIRYSRGHITILDVPRLRETACECYQTVRSHAERLLGAPKGE